jgi:1-acyl-sn-glycerol-3-phosphate acyltransferase
MSEQEKPKRRRRSAADNGSAEHLDAGNAAPAVAELPVELDETVTLVDATSATDGDTLAVGLDGDAVRLVDEAAAAQPEQDAELPAVLDSEDVRLVDPGTPVAVKNLASVASPANSRIDSLLASLEAEIRAMPTADAERQSAVAEVVGLIRQSVTRWPKKVIENAVAALKSNINSDYLDADFWKGISMVLRYQLDANVDMLKRRWRGDYMVDEFGLDYELVELAKPLLTFMYSKYWRVEATGLENVPEEGRALLVCNHSGVLPWDGAMVGTALMNEHPAGRLLRNLHLSWFTSLPVIAPLLSRLGQVQALPANAERLLERDELVGVFPEGLKGVGKLFKDRYKLARFGRGGFVKVAVKTGAPIIPVSIVGSEEIHPQLVNVKPLAKLLNFPYFPLTPTFPWLGPLGFIPLPSKWYIIFGEPIPTEQYGPEGAEDPLLISQLSDKVRSTIQSTILEKLKTRPGVFFGD